MFVTRKNLSTCREGEYEGLAAKLTDPNWAPDFGPSAFNESVAKSGATAIASRDFLIAYNLTNESLYWCFCLFLKFYLYHP